MSVAGREQTRQWGNMVIFVFDEILVLCLNNGGPGRKLQNRTYVEGSVFTGNCEFTCELKRILIMKVFNIIWFYVSRRRKG